MAWSHSAKNITKQSKKQYASGKHCCQNARHEIMLLKIMDLSGSTSCNQQEPSPALLILGQVTSNSVEIQVIGKIRTGHFNQMTITNSGRIFMSWIREQASGRLLLKHRHKIPVSEQLQSSEAGRTTQTPPHYSKQQQPSTRCAIWKTFLTKPVWALVNCKQNNRKSCPGSKQPDCPAGPLLGFALQEKSHTFSECETASPFLALRTDSGNSAHIWLKMIPRLQSADHSASCFPCCKEAASLLDWGPSPHAPHQAYNSKT